MKWRLLAALAVADGLRPLPGPRPGLAPHQASAVRSLSRCCDADLDAELDAELDAASLDAALATAEAHAGDALDPALAPVRPIDCGFERAVALRVPDADQLVEAITAAAHTAALGADDYDAAMYEHVSAQPPAYWAQLWPCALALSRRLAAEPHLVAGRSVLDLGCGVGLSSVAAALAGASAVLATDREPAALRYTRANAEENGAQGIAAALLDWAADAPPDARQAALAAEAGLEAGSAAMLAAGAQFDVVLCSDVLYDEEAPAQLAALLRARVAPGGLVCLADNADRPYGDRRRDELRALLCGRAGEASAGPAFEQPAAAARCAVEVGFGHEELRARQGDVFEVVVWELRRL